MAARLETIGSLGRKLFIEVPADEIQAEENTRIEKLMKTVNLPGFRKGKIPQKVIQQRYGDSVYNEVLNEALYKNLQKALEEYQLRPAGSPRIENLQIKKQEPLSYEVIFDIYPVVELGDLAKISVERKSVIISDQDVEEVLGKLRKQQSNWSLVDRPSENGDKVILDVRLEMEGIPPKDMPRLPAELGSKTMIPGFEEGLVGKKAGDEVILDLTFPDPYFDANMAGKPAKFTVQVLEVLEAKSLSDEELVEKMAIEGGVSGLQENIREHLQREANQLVKGEVKNQLWEKLIESTQFELPPSLVEEALHYILHPHQENDGSHHHDDATDEQRKQAEKTVRIRLLLTEMLKLYQIKLDVERLRSKVEEMVSVYENPAEMAKYYYENKEFVTQLQSSILEEQVIDELLKHVEIINKEVSYEEVFKR